MSVSITLEMSGVLNRPNRNVAEEICKAIERIVTENSGGIAITEQRTQYRDFLSDEAFNPDESSNHTIKLYGSYHATE